MCILHNACDSNMNTTFSSRLRQREINQLSSKQFVHCCYIDAALLQRLQLEHELEGHTGCVNCLDWNETGHFLASGSDDTNVMLWDPLSYKCIKTVQTGHHGNIFSVKFFPKTNDKVIATGAADSHVFIHDICYDEKIHGFPCNSRVKRLVASSGVPHNLWSSSEDGMVREFDIREPTKSCTRTIINLTTMCGPNAECKCMAINPLHPHLLAVGANDAYVRLYDRRMIKVSRTQPQNGQKRKDTQSACLGCVSYFIPGHLHYKQKEYRRRLRYLCSTYMAFSPQGNELLVNVGGEQLYLFDLYANQKALFQPTLEKCCKSKKSGANGALKSSSSNDGTVCQLSRSALTSSFSFFSEVNTKQVPQHKKLPHAAEQLKEKANELFGQQNFTPAIMMYNAALNLAPTSSVLFGNRAAAFIKRAWDGDLYAALRDCYSALAFNPDHVKAHFRLVRCLFELKWLKEAHSNLIEFKSKYPDYAKTKAYCALEKDVKNASKSSKKHERDFDEEDLMTESEAKLRSEACDYLQRYCGHCNTTTDIKEANFLGSNGQYIVAGSDDGSFFVWEKQTSNLVRVMRADDSIVNCLQPHPHMCMLATSGIDPLVRLWSPLPGMISDDRTVLETEKVAAANQRRMNTDPLETMLLSMGMHARVEDEEGEVVPCRTS